VSRCIFPKMMTGYAGLICTVSYQIIIQYLSHLRRYSKTMVDLSVILLPSKQTMHSFSAYFAHIY
jgi:hypothetical protein